MKFSAPKAVLFDLDGTLVDSAPDLMAALTYVRRAIGLTEPTPIAASAFVSGGAAAMMRAGLPHDWHSQIDRLRDDFLDYYEQNICVHSKLYPGATELLARLTEQGIAWGIVTNKPIALAQKLVRALKLESGALLGGDSIIGADKIALKKPHPAPLLAACGELGVDPASAWMIGDDPRDILAGQRAGCAVTIACAFGYLGDSAPVENWGATWVAQSLFELRI